MNPWQYYQLIPCLLCYGVKLCFIMGPAEFNLIYSSPGLELEPSLETNRKYRRKQSRSHSLESRVLQKLPVATVNVTSCPYVVFSNFHSQDYITLSRFVKGEFVWLSLRRKFVASMHWGEGGSDFAVFSIGGI